MIGKIFLAAAAVVGGIYLTSEEGKNARLALLKKKAAFEPIIKDLLAQAKAALDGSEKLNAEDVRASVNQLVEEARATISSLDFDKTVETIREAISVASHKIRAASVATQVEFENGLTRPKRQVTAQSKKGSAQHQKSAKTKKGK